MTKLEEAVAQAVHQMSREAKAELAHQLLAELSDDQQRAVDEAWLLEIRRRVKEIDAGEELLDGDEVMRQVARTRSQMKHRSKRDAALEMFEAVKYYEGKQAGLGGEFLDELDAGIETVKGSPNRWPVIESAVRRYRLKRFPYSIVYEVKDDTVVIIAIAHSSRKPDYWRDRT